MTELARTTNTQPVVLPAEYIIGQEAWFRVPYRDDLWGGHTVHGIITNIELDKLTITETIENSDGTTTTRDWWNYTNHDTNNKVYTNEVDFLNSLLEDAHKRLRKYVELTGVDLRYTDEI